MASVTTLGSALLLLWCKIQPFVKMGKLVAMNTALSIFFALFVFCSLLAAVGPTGRCGTIRCCCPVHKHRK